MSTKESFEERMDRITGTGPGIKASKNKDKHVFVAEGEGLFKCGLHLDFVTVSPTEWEKHVVLTHTMSGTAPCLYCGTPVSFKGLPRVPTGKPAPTMCPECKEKWFNK